MMLERRVDGMIFGDAHVDGALLDELAAEGVVFVLVSRAAANDPSVSDDDYRGGRLVAEHLLVTGRTDIAILGGSSFAETFQNRTRGAIDVFRETGIVIREHRVVYGNLEAGGVPDAIFATNDFAAAGALGVLRDRRLTVPREVAVVGFNDMPVAADLPISLTTVRSPMHEMGRHAFHMLLSMPKRGAVISEKLRPKLIVRALTGVAGVS